MRYSCLAGLVCLVLASLSSAQGASPATALATGDVPQIKVGPDEAVITVNDFCTDPPQIGTPCKTVITRAQFEKLTEALQPGMSLSLRLNVANAYARNLRMSAAAEKRGLDKTPAFEEEMRYARMQLLSQDLARDLQAEANNITDADLEDDYKKNEASFEEATLARIFVPRAKQSAAAHTVGEDAQTKADEDAMTKVAADLRARAVNGEDPDKLQVEAYTEAGIPGTNSNTKMEKVRRDTLPPQHEAVMDLKPGEVSKVFSDPGGAHFIYKMIKQAHVDAGRGENRDPYHDFQPALSRQHEGFQGDVVFSDAYFNPPGKPVTAPQRNRLGRRNKPPSSSREDHD